MVALRDALFAFCDALRRSEFTAAEAFSAFDRDGSGRVSVAEFTSLLRA
eukprot:gene21889-16345_t